ncbi:MAG: ABC transporter substrate-binding protein, partial [Clostridia bacterium]
SGGSVKVWLSGAGRDQAQVIKDLINESFTPETGIKIDLELVQGSLIEATLAGTGPDVALLVAEDQPVNFALRGALQDLSVFDTYSEVEKRFYPSAVEPFRFNGGVYAIPDTQVFDMLFYRTDVFERLGIKAPDTWDEFYEILPVIQRNNLQITTQDLFSTLLFQNGGSYYNEGQTAALLDSDEAIKAMETYTNLYRNYGFEVKTDFYSRFRSGEVIMSIQPYQMYNQLVAAAPEITGRWAMIPIPATKTENGLDRSAGSVTTGTIMLRDAKDKEAAWDFMDWWSSDEVKAKYGLEIEGLLGASARFTPANKGVMSMLPWPDEQLKSLETAQSCVKGIPQIPGSYYTARAIQNGFRSIVYNGESVRKALSDQNEMINYEITKKRAEFGLEEGGAD